MYVIVQHRLMDPAAASRRGDRLKRGDGAPPGTRVLQFYPGQDEPLVTCLWEAESVADVQSYVDETMGDASTNICYVVNADAAFAERPASMASTVEA